MTDHEKRIREALEAGPTSALYTHPRDDNKWRENEAFAMACNPAAIRALLADLDAVRGALSAAKDGGWQPIETCPRDFGGTKFDVWANGQRYADCWWGKATYEQGECGVVYQSDYDCNGPVDSYVKGATAWQPLPNPPKGEV